MTNYFIGIHRDITHISDSMILLEWQMGFNQHKMG